MNSQNVNINGLNINFQNLEQTRDIDKPTQFTKSNLKDNLKKKNILIVHGWSKTGSLKWQGFISSLSSKLKELGQTNYNILSLDLPGFGKSDQPTEVWGSLEYSIFLNNFLKKLDIFPDVIICHSFGGAVTVNYLNLIARAVDNSEDDKGSKIKVIMMAPAIVRKKVGLLKIALQKVATTAKNVFLKTGLEQFYNKARPIFYKFYGSADYINSGGIMTKIFLKIITQDTSQLLTKLPNQTLLLWGNKDVQTPIWQAKIIQSKLTNCQFIQYKNVFHAIHLQNQDQSIQDITKFILKD